MLLRTAGVVLAMAALLSAGCAASSPPETASPPASALPGPDAPTPPEHPTPPTLDVEAAERALHRAVNRARARHGRSPLAWSDSLRLLARRHSRDMAQRGYFSHTNPDDETPTDRARRLGLPVTREHANGAQRTGIAENLSRATRYRSYRDVYRRRGDKPRQFVRRIYDWKTLEEVVRQVVDGWLESPPHRRTLLSPTYRRHGVGVATTGQWIYVTQNLF